MTPITDAWICRFGGAAWRQPRWDGLDTGWRQLPHILLETARNGAWHLEVGSAHLVASPGETLIVSTGIRHRLVAEPTKDAGAMTSSWVFIDWEHSGWPLRITDGAAVVQSPPLARRVESLARQARADSLSGQAAWLSIAFTVLEEVSGLFAPASAPDERVARAMKLARDHCGNPLLRRSDLARAAGVSEAHLQDLFKAASGQAPMEYLTNLRLRRAMEMLAQTRTPIGEIAALCGFASPYYFSRFFREKSGLSPREFRTSQTATTAGPMGRL